MGLMTLILEQVPPALGMSIETILIIIYVFGSIIPMAKDFKIGIIIFMFLNLTTFVVTYIYEYNFVPFLTMMLISLVILALSIYASASAGQEGQIV